MKKLIAFSRFVMWLFMPVLWAADGCDQHLSREDFGINRKRLLLSRPD